MARKLKTYQTSLGFFDLAIAAPSMKAAAEAWGVKTSEFKRGFAKETHDAAVVAATMAKPGVVLRRSVGSAGPFTEHAKLPKDLPGGRVEEELAEPRSKSETSKVDDKTGHTAALAFEREQKRRETARRREEARREKEREKREQAVAKAERALAQARREHEAKARKIEADRAAAERRSQAEEKRREQQKEILENVLRRARD
jgi:colicin import membrane protein